MLCLHSPDNVELWNPEAPIATFWEIRYFWSIKHFQTYYIILMCFPSNGECLGKPKLTLWPGGYILPVIKCVWSWPSNLTLSVQTLKFCFNVWPFRHIANICCCNEKKRLTSNVFVIYKRKKVYSEIQISEVGWTIFVCITRVLYTSSGEFRIYK